MKRHVFTAAALLVVGAITTWAVAWVWAAWGVAPHRDHGAWTLSSETPPCWLMHGHFGPGASIVRVSPLMEDGKSFSVFRNLGRMRGDVHDSIAQRFTTAPATADQYTRYGFDERGWPLRCLRSEHSYRYVSTRGQMIGDVHVNGGIQLWPEQTARGGWALQRVRALPLIPIWSAFIVNVLLYALVAAIVFVGYPRMIRTLGWKRSRRRAIVAAMIALPLVLGVAWAAAAFYESDQMPRVHSADLRPTGSDGRTSYLSMDRQDRLGGTRLIFSSSFSGTTDNDRMPVPPIDGAAPRWAASYGELARERDWKSFEWMTAEAVGWPARAFAASFTTRVVDQFSVGVAVHSGIRLDELPKGFQLENPRTMRLLPTDIIWSGFLLNWLFYVIVLFGLISAPSALKRGWRIRHGRCAECGYDLRANFDAGCSECGWRRASAAT